MNKALLLTVLGGVLIILGFATALSSRALPKVSVPVITPIALPGQNSGATTTTAAPSSVTTTTTTTTKTTVTPSRTGTVTGKVTTSPTCPVEQNSPQPGCEPRPYQTQVSALSKSGSVIASTMSDAHGNFSLKLPAGSYTIRAKNGSVLPRCTDQTAKVTAGTITTVSISCDSGIR